jgi:hypothetical protein
VLGRRLSGGCGAVAWWGTARFGPHGGTPPQGAVGQREASQTTRVTEASSQLPQTCVVLKSRKIRPFMLRMALAPVSSAALRTPSKASPYLRQGGCQGHVVAAVVTLTLTIDLAI